MGIFLASFNWTEWQIPTKAFCVNYCFVSDICKVILLILSKVIKNVIFIKYTVNDKLDCQIRYVVTKLFLWGRKHQQKPGVKYDSHYKSPISNFNPFYHLQLIWPGFINDRIPLPFSSDSFNHLTCTNSESFLGS